MDTAELLQYMKFIPVFSGEKTTLHNFISTIELLDTKKPPFFDFVLKNQLGIKIQNEIKQDIIPTNMRQLIDKLRETFRTKKT